MADAGKNSGETGSPQQPDLFTPRPHALTLEESHRLVDIFIQDLLCGKNVDLSKLQHVKDFDIALDPRNIFDVLSKLLYYRFYRHNHFVHEINIALLLKMIHNHYKFGVSQEIDQLLNVCFARAINNYIHIHISYLIDGEKVVSNNDNLTIPKRNEKLITSYCEKLILQYREVFKAIPAIALVSQYTNLKQLETNDRAMYTIITEHGFNEEAQELLSASWPIFMQVYPSNDAEARYDTVKKDLSELTAEHCGKYIDGLDPTKYDKMIGIVENILSKFAE